MKTKTQNYNDVTVIELQGDLDIEAVGLLKNLISEVIKKAVKGIVLDMRGIGFIDSSGLEQLLWARDYCNENNCQLRLAGLDENCEKILEITQLDREFEEYKELSGAVKSFA